MLLALFELAVIDRLRQEFEKWIQNTVLQVSIMMKGFANIVAALIELTGMKIL
jgi:hypothetical protein